MPLVISSYSKSAKARGLISKAPQAKMARAHLAIMARFEPAYRKATLRLATALRTRVRESLRAGLTRAAELLAPKDWRADATWLAFGRELERAYVAGIEASGALALKQAQLDGRMVFRVEKARSRIDVPPNPHSLKWIREHGGELVQGISDEQRGVIRDALAAMHKEGRRPQSVESTIKSLVGLNEQQAGAVERRRGTMLEAGVDFDKVDAAVEHYADDLLDARAETIARTEGKEAIERGQADAWRVAQNEQLLPAATRRRWTSMPDSDRRCDMCESMDGQIVGLDEPFVSDDVGEVGNPPLHPRCRCMQALVFGDEE